MTEGKRCYHIGFSQHGNGGRDSASQQQPPSTSTASCALPTPHVFMEPPFPLDPYYRHILTSHHASVLVYSTYSSRPVRYKTNMSGFLSQGMIRIFKRSLIPTGAADVKEAPAVDARTYEDGQCRRFSRAGNTRNT